MYVKSTAVVALWVWIASFWQVSLTWAEQSSDLSYVGTLEVDDYFEFEGGGLPFPPGSKSLLILDEPRLDVATIVLLPHEAVLEDPGIGTLEVSDPVNIAFDSKATRSFRLLIVEPHTGELIGVREGLGDYTDPDAIMRVDLGGFDVQDPRGLTIDPGTKNLFMLDGVGPQLIRIELEQPGDFAGTFTTTKYWISWSELIEPADTRELTDLHGLAFNPADGHLYVFDREGLGVYELSDTGEILASHNFSSAEPTDIELAGVRSMVFAPSRDGTDDPGEMSLYVVSTGGVNGVVTEWSLTALTVASRSPILTTVTQ